MAVEKLTVEVAVGPIIQRALATLCEDGNVRDIVVEMVERAAHGKAKYGVTTENAPLTSDAWEQHLTEELMDALVYLRALKRQRANRMKLYVDLGELVAARDAVSGIPAMLTTWSEKLNPEMVAIEVVAVLP